ncbi:unnamed protein product, partial [Iphiclides podalirius]
MDFMFVPNRSGTIGARLVSPPVPHYCGVNRSVFAPSPRSAARASVLAVRDTANLRFPHRRKNMAALSPSIFFLGGDVRVVIELRLAV